MSDKPLYLLNILWFKKDGGRELYKEYAKSMISFEQEIGVRRYKSFEPVESIVGEFDADLVFFLEYPDGQTYRQLMENEDYQTITKLREEAIEKSLVVRCKRPEK